MYIICSECKKQFFMNEKSVSMLTETIHRNPDLKILCSYCGYQIIKDIIIKDV